MFPPRTFRVASMTLASGRHTGTVTGMMKEANFISMGHSKQRAVVTPGLPQANICTGLVKDFLSWRSQEKPTDFLRERTNDSVVA